MSKVLILLGCLFHYLKYSIVLSRILILFSQIDYSKGFGGKYGVQKERVDQAC